MSDCVIVSHIIMTLNQFYLHVHAIPTNTDLKGDSHVFVTQEVTVFQRFCFDFFVSLPHIDCRGIFLYSYLRLPFTNQKSL